MRSEVVGLGDAVREDGGVLQTGPFGSQLKQAEYADEGVPVIMPKDIRNGEVVTETVARVSEEKADRLARHRVAINGIVLPRRGEVTKRAFIGEQQAGWLCGSGCIKIETTGLRIWPKYLYYFLSAPGSIEWLERNAVGSTMSNLSAEIVSRFPIRLPTIDVQEEIAAILSAYDNLIENNRRRIALLEEAARLLYREWFVNFRFPGHDHDKITDGVPVGWERVKIDQILTAIQSGGRPRGGASEGDGIPSIGAENVIGLGRYDFSREKYVPEEYFAKMRRGVIHSRDVLLYKDGAHIGRSSMCGDGFPHSQCAVNEHVFILRADAKVGQSYLYFWLSQTETRQSVVNLNANTAQPGISQDKLKTLWFLLPTEPLTHLFNERVEAQVAQIFRLALMNQKLAEARNLLLPRLMNGEIAV